MIPVIIFILFLVAIDVYSFFGLKGALFTPPSVYFKIGYIVSIALTIFGVIMMFQMFARQVFNQTAFMNIAIGLGFSIIVAKLIFASFFLVEDVMRSFLWLFQSAMKFRASEFISRSYIWGLVVFVFGSSLMLLLNYGVWFGKYHYKVHHKTLYFNNLPESFDGFKIAQVSDLHLGTFDNKKKVQKGFTLLQQQHPDAIVFTGDMVNNRAEEATPYIDMMKELRAPYGKFTIWGNHDYGDYVPWKNEQERQENLDKLEAAEQQMGLQWLNNKHVPFSKNGDTIYLAGVENWGLKPFPQYGELDSALANISPTDFTVLLSHDPTHWREKVLESDKNVELTLSGHTHGMQFGIELGQFRWSPVKYKYPDWAGLHHKNGQYLYVNRGFGHIGYPGRLGIRPEITVIELKRKK